MEIENTKVNLYITPYLERNEERLKELETCYIKNLQAGFDNIYLVVEEKDLLYVSELRNRDYPTKSNITIVVTGVHRPIFQEYINVSKRHDENTIHCVMNGDIFIEPVDLDKIKALNWQRKLFVALSRWDLYPDGSNVLLERSDSQDAYFWKGDCTVTNALCPNGNCGSDNSICFKFKSMGYDVVNPSKDLKIYHLHNVKLNNYRVNGTGDVLATHICPEPYYFPVNCFISDIK